MITERIEPDLYRYLTHRALTNREVLVHKVGGIEDHVHMAVSLPPTIEIAKWIGDIKGASSHHINHGPAGLHALDWQAGYGVVSFGRRDLPWVIEYITNQRQHHAAGSAVDRLERITQMEFPPPEGGETQEGR